MIKKITSVLLIITIMIFAAAPEVFAAETVSGFITDSTGSLSDKEISSLNSEAEKVFEDTNVSIIVSVESGKSLDQLKNDTTEYYTKAGSPEDSIMLLVSDDSWYIKYTGRVDQKLSEVDQSILWTYYSNGTTAADKISAFITKSAEYFKNRLSDNTKSALLVDNAEVLNSSDSTKILDKLNEISKRQSVDVTIVTVSDTENKSAQSFADEIYDENGYGQGSDFTGIVLFIATDTRDWAISTRGLAIKMFTDDGIQYISDKITSYLSDNNYSQAFMTYAELCDKFITQSKTGDPYTNKNLPKEPLSKIWIAIAVGIGALIAFIVTSILKSQLKSVAYKSNATDYTRKGSLNVRERRDLFLYKKVERTAKNNSGGSSTHTDSSNTEHGGSSGKF
jgi:uncharacterized protein